jgi:hypothetical protein
MGVNLQGLAEATETAREALDEVVPRRGPPKGDKGFSGGSIALIRQGPPAAFRRVTGLAFLTVIGVPACTVPESYHSPLGLVNPPASTTASQTATKPNAAPS